MSSGLATVTREAYRRPLPESVRQIADRATLGAVETWKVLVVAGALVLVAAACGDSGDDTTTTVPATIPPTAAPTTVPPQTTLPPESTTTTLIETTTTTNTTLPPSEVFVTTGGLGSVRVGQTVEQAEEASGLTLTPEADPISDDCFFVTVADDPVYAGVAFMVYENAIGRVDVGPPSPITTRSGAGIGTTVEQLNALFPGQIEDASEFVVDGTAVMFVPRDEADAQFRVIFVTEGDVVTGFRSGVLPPVGFGEGCA